MSQTIINERVIENDHLLKLEQNDTQIFFGLFITNMISNSVRPNFPYM